MNTRIVILLGFLLTATACGGATTQDTLTKSEAQALIDSGDADDAICTENGFNDDGVCDDWCPDGDDADCPTSNACASGDTKQADDGCNTCYCESGSWACTEIACDNNGNNSSDSLGLQIGECDTDTDPLAVDSAKISGDQLVVGVSYSGGCKEHGITACWDGTFLESNPVQARLVLEHDANGDTCEAYLQETLTIDLSSMKDSYKSGYQTESGTIFVQVDQAESLDYSF